MLLKYPQWRNDRDTHRSLDNSPDIKRHPKKLSNIRNNYPTQTEY